MQINTQQNLQIEQKSMVFKNIWCYYYKLIPNYFNFRQILSINLKLIVEFVYAHLGVTWTEDGKTLDQVLWFLYVSNYCDWQHATFVSVITNWITSFKISVLVIGLPIFIFQNYLLFTVFWF